MKLKGIIFCFLFLIALSGFSQTFTIKGKIVDETNSPAIGASIMLLSKNDSSLVGGGATDEKGYFLIENVSSNQYILKIKYLGYADHVKSIFVKDNLDLNTISLKTTATKLKEVEVQTQAVIATQNGDTTSYNSKAFKVNKDATAEDLVTKMPGITSQDGVVQAQGENVKQVYVDGKPFFGDDPNTVLKNIPAEIIDKVQVFDKKSDQSTFTGFDDGNLSKTINIITKVQFRNGVFGKLSGGYGYQDKYKGSGVFNRFKDKQRLTLMALSNNVNEQNFSTEDLLGVVGTSSGGGGNRGGYSGGGNRGGGSGGSGAPQNSADNFLVNIKNGITTTHAFGANYSDKWGSKINITAAYFFNLTDNRATSSLLRQYVIGNSNGQNYTELSDGTNTNSNHRLNIRFDCKLDSQNSILIQPKISLQMNNGKSGLTGENTKFDNLISNTDNHFKSNLLAYNISFPVLFRHSFAKKGRTLSLDLNPSYNSSGGNNSLQNYNSYYGAFLVRDTVDQQSNLNKYGLNSVSNLSYTEPLSKVSFLSANYILTYNYSNSQKNTYDRNPAGTDYTVHDSLLSNVFNNYYRSHSGGLSYRYQKEKVNFSFGGAYQYAQLYKQQIFPGSYSLTKAFESFLPNAQFQYRVNTSKNLRINYRANNAAPSIDQLQDVLNNSNSLQLSIGNPDLKQNYQNNLNIRYSSVNTLKSTSLFIVLSGMYTNNYIGNSTMIAAKDTTVYNHIFLSKGTQLSRPVNLNDYYNARAFMNYSFAIKKLKSNLNINAGFNYSNVPALINNKTNYSKTSSPSLGVVLSSNISEKLDFTISSNTSYNLVQNTLQSDLNSTYYNQNSKVKLTVTPVKWLVFQTEYNNQYYSGLTSGYNQNISLWNAAVAVKFLKDKNAEIRLFVFDILKQNNSIQRNTTETYIEDTQTNILQRYFMLSFTYNFKKYFTPPAKK